MLRWGATLKSEIRDRLEEEICCAESDDACSYFLLIADLVAAIRRAGGLIGPGRGAATGSVLCYALGITDIDPIRYDLLPTHFLDGNNHFPDVDLDVDSEGRLIARKCLIERHGNDCVAHLMRNGKLHPTALVVASRPISEIAPVDRIRTRGVAGEVAEVLSTSITLARVEKLGLLKLDFVPSPWLTLMRRVLVDLKVGIRPEEYDGFIRRIPHDDAKALAIILAGDTEGVPFFYDQGVISHVSGLSWRTFDDMLACYRELRNTAFKTEHDFTRGHHISFALVAYRIAWLKAHYRVAFDKQYDKMIAEGWKFS